ncbi:MAG: TPM domain-containing protein [Bacilli bacterium]
MKFLKLRSNSINLLILFLLFIVPIKVNALVNPTNEFYVNDYADILSEETENYIIENGKILEKNTNAQIVVVTVKNLEGMDIESYSLELARKFTMGGAKKDNGLLLLLALEEREFRVEVGYGLEGILPDGKTGRIQDEYIIPYLKEDKWDEGVLKGYKAFYNEVALSSGFDSSVNPVEFEEVESNDIGTSIFSCYIGLAFILAILFFKIFKIKTKKQRFIFFAFFQTVSTVLMISLIYIFSSSIFNYIISYMFITILNFIITSKSGFKNLKTGGLRLSSGSSFTRGGSSGGGGSFGGGGSSRRF